MQLRFQGSLLHQLVNNEMIPLMNTEAQKAHYVWVPNPAEQTQLILQTTHTRSI
jgi:hypothetical protein